MFSSSCNMFSSSCRPNIFSFKGIKLIFGFSSRPHKLVYAVPLRWDTIFSITFRKMLPHHLITNKHDKRCDKVIHLLMCLFLLFGNEFWRFSIQFWKFVAPSSERPWGYMNEKTFNQKYFIAPGTEWEQQVHLNK